MAMKAGKSMDEMQNFLDRLWSHASVAENWDRLMERGVDILFEPGTHDYVAYDIVWGAQNHPQVPVYYQPNGGHSQRRMLLRQRTNRIETRFSGITSSAAIPC